MRRIIAVALVGATVAALAVTPAVAGKSKGKHVEGSFGGTLLPLPNYSSYTATPYPGCRAGQEGVHWVGQEFTSPGKGTLRFWMEGFTGDHDIYVFQGDLKVAESVQEQVGPAMAPDEEEISLPMKKGQTVTLVACNWLGAPNVEANFEGHFK